MLDASRIPPGLLDGRLALVSGVGRPHGLEIALGLARAGASIIAIDPSLADVTRAAGAIRAARGRAWNFALDATSAEACSELARRLTREIGAIDILVNHAGFGVREHAGPDRTEIDWRRALDASVVRTLNLSHAWLPALSVTHGCVIIVAPNALPSVRSAHAGSASHSKGAVQTTTLSLAREMAPHGVRVNAVAPGLIASEAARSPGVEGDAGAGRDRGGAGSGAASGTGSGAGAGSGSGSGSGVRGGAGAAATRGGGSGNGTESRSSIIDRRSGASQEPIRLLRDSAVALGAAASERAAQLEQRVPLGRAGEASELVAPTVFLASEMSSYVTGVVLPVDGGLLAAG